MIDLKDASRDALIRPVVAQHETIQQQERIIADLHAEIARLTAQVSTLTARVGTLIAALEAATRTDGGKGSGGVQGMPGLKAATARAPASKRERKRREQGFVRHRMEPTQRMVHAMERCPICGEGLTGGSVTRTREVIEIAVVPAIVTAHAFVERWCPHCRTRHTPLVDLVGAVAGKQRFGVGLVSLIAMLREEGRLPLETIRWYLQTCHALSVSVGAITAAIQQAARAGTRAVAAIREAVRGPPVAHADETGWREGGINGYV